MEGTYVIWANKHVVLPKKTLLSELEAISAAKEAVKLVLGVSFESYDIRSRETHLFFPRQCFGALVRKHTRLSFKDIGKLFTKPYDHSTIVYQCDRIKDVEELGYRDVKYKTWMAINEKYKALTKGRK
jgi:chromosomal replication initiation ATPase DnaA